MLARLTIFKILNTPFLRREIVIYTLLFRYVVIRFLCNANNILGNKCSRFIKMSQIYSMINEQCASYDSRGRSPKRTDLFRYPIFEVNKFNFAIFAA